jgi:hypothetical protein
MSKFQPDHMGRKTPNSDPTPPLSQSHGFNADKPYRGDTPNIARDAGRGKDVHAILPHGSSTARQIAGAGKGGMGHATAVVDGGQTITTSAAAAPLAHAYGGQVPKLRGPAPIKSGMRDRGPNAGTDLHELGRRIMDEAVKN